jgi:nucleotide-binding universal stress UspA family protein
MRIVVGHDGSPGADRAVDLVRTLDLPTNSAIKLVRAIPGDGENGAASAARIRERAALEEVAVAVRRDGVEVDVAVADGRASDVINTLATRFEADLIVVGSRGNGPIATLLVGSVAAEVTERADRPVLVARTSEVRPIVLATDGSVSARAAEEALLAFVAFASIPLTVVSVADVSFRYPGRLSLSTHEVALEADARRNADAAARRLRGVGWRPKSRVRRGDPAMQIIATAKSVGAGLIVVGSRGRMGASGLMLGSVSRDVLHSSETSVLIARAASVDGT